MQGIENKKKKAQFLYMTKHSILDITVSFLSSVITSIQRITFSEGAYGEQLSVYSQPFSVYVP